MIDGVLGVWNIELGNEKEWRATEGSLGMREMKGLEMLRTF